MSQKTLTPNKSLINRKWHLIDAKDQILGRLATRIARLLIGKGKIFYSPHVDCGDFVVIINAEAVALKGNNKKSQKIDFRHSRYPGGTTITPYGKLLMEKPDRAVQLAVAGMLPKNKIRSHMMTRLKIYKRNTHPHAAQFYVPKPPSAEKIKTVGETQ